MLPPHRKLFIFDEIYWSLLYFMAQTTNLVNRYNVSWYFYHSNMHLANDTVLTLISFCHGTKKVLSKSGEDMKVVIMINVFIDSFLGLNFAGMFFLTIKVWEVLLCTQSVQWWNNRILNHSLISTIWISQVKINFTIYCGFLLRSLLKLVKFKHLFYLYKFIITHMPRKCTS